MSKKIIRVALAGNPNCGKTSVFNSLTGLRQTVGNYPGVTFEKKEGRRHYKEYEIRFVDLPGTYSLSAYSEDEIVARNFLVHEKPDVVVNVVDSSNLERNLYLTVQLLELEAPLVLAMNMTDVVLAKGYSINYKELSAGVCSPVVPTVGNRFEGAEDLLDVIIERFEKEGCDHQVHVDYGIEIFDEVRKLEAVLGQESSELADFPLRWLALKTLEQDPSVLENLQDLASAQDIVAQKDKSRNHLKAHFGETLEIIMADRRYGFVSGLVKSVRVPVIERQDSTDTIDKLVLNRILGFPIFVLVMYGIFKFTFSGSQPFVDLLTSGFDRLAVFFAAHLPDNLFSSFVIDGLINGVGSLLSFVPLIMFMFLAIAFFEDSGYMARAAFLMDKFMTRFGLHGKSFLPLMISTNGCAVLGILASRTLENPKDRLITMLVTPFMICGAKLPIFAVFIAAFFPAEYAPAMMFFLYALSIVIALSAALVLRKFVFKGEVEHFVMELPPYRVPSAKGVFLKMWERGWVYIKKAGTVILMISVVVWAGFAFPRAPKSAGASVQVEQSIAGRFAHVIEPALKPIGLDWRSGVALVGGVAAKEVVVSTFGTIYSLQEESQHERSLREQFRNDPWWNPLRAFVFLLFSLLYTPCCVASIVFFKESRHWGWTSLLVFGSSILAWLVCFVVYQLGMLLGIGM